MLIQISRTALAEAELEYNNEHVSPAITIRFEVVNSGEPEPVYLLLWTTTPWTLPFNEAVYFSRQLEYSLVKIESLPGSYIVASILIEHNAKKLKVCLLYIFDEYDDVIKFHIMNKRIHTFDLTYRS